MVQWYRDYHNIQTRALEGRALGALRALRALRAMGSNVINLEIAQKMAKKPEI